MFIKHLCNHSFKNLFTERQKIPTQDFSKTITANQSQMWDEILSAIVDERFLDIGLMLNSDIFTLDTKNDYNKL